MNDASVLTIRQALTYLENQLKSNSRKTNSDSSKQGEDQKFKEEVFSRYEGAIFENLAPSQLTNENIQIDKPKISKSFFTETFFAEMNKEYETRQRAAWDLLKDMKLVNHNEELIPTSDGKSDNENSRSTRGGRQTDNESKPNENESDLRAEVQIDAYVTLRGLQLFELSERPGHFLSSLGGEKLKEDYEPNKSYDLVIEIAVNFLTQIDKKLSQLIHYIIWFKLMKKSTENMVFMILSGYNQEEFIKFVNKFNAFYQDDSKLTDLVQYQREYHRFVMLKQVLKEGAKILFLHKPFYLRKCFIKDSQSEFENFVKESKKLHTDLQETRKKFIEVDKQLHQQKTENQKLEAKAIEDKQIIAKLEESNGQYKEQLVKAEEKNNEYKLQIEKLEKKLQMLLKDSMQGDQPSDLMKDL